MKRTQQRFQFLQKHVITVMIDFVPIIDNGESFERIFEYQILW